MHWVAIGDSFTYLNDHLDETGYRVSRGYLSRIADRIPSLQLDNIGINGSTFADWIDQEIPAADLYTVLLGTNDWHQGFYTLAVSAHRVHCQLIQVAELLFHGTLCISIRLKFLEDSVNTFVIVFRQAVEAAKTCVGSRQRIGFHPTATGILIEIVGRAHAGVQIGQVNA